MVNDKPTLFIHIPKTAGSSFRQVMYSSPVWKTNYRHISSKKEWNSFVNKYLCKDCIYPVNFKLFSAHLPMDGISGTSSIITNLIQNKTIYKKMNWFTIIREPVERVLSEYNFITYGRNPIGFEDGDIEYNAIKNKLKSDELKGKTYHKELSEYSWEQDSNTRLDWITDWYDTYGKDSVNPVSRMAEDRLPIFNMREGVTFNEGENILHWKDFYELDWYEYAIHTYTGDTQVKWLLGKQYLGDYEVTDKDYNTLIDTMEELNFSVGIKEQFKKTILYFNKLYKTDYSTEDIPTLKKGPTEKPKLDKKQLKEIEKHNKYDVKLYKYFLDKFNAVGEL